VPDHNEKITLVINAKQRAAEVAVHGKPEINLLIEYFEEKMELKMPRAGKQRFAANTLIQQHGVSLALRAVDAVVAVRGRQYAPEILSLEDLRDKWNKLVAYYQRNVKSDQQSQAIRRATGAK
jgi:hypothetical protein